MKKVTNQALLVAVLSLILNGCIIGPSTTATPTLLTPTKEKPTSTPTETTETESSTSNIWQPPTGTSGSVILQEDNPLPKNRLISKDSGELDDNRIASYWHGLWEYDPLSDLLNETLNLGVKRYRIAINSGDQDKVDWTKSEFSVDPSHDEFITSLANNGIQITYFLSFWDKATYPNGVGAPCPRFKTEQEIEHYLEFVRFIVGHFKDRVQNYEIYNEPDIHACPQWIEVDDYINLVRRAVPVIREEYPDAKIQVGGVADLSNPGTQDYLFSILESDIMPLVDIISWHPFYGSSPETDPDYYYAYPTLVQKIKDTAANNGFSGEYTAEEMNWRPYTDPDPDHLSPYSELESAKYQIRGILMHLGMDVIAGNLRIPSNPPPYPNHYMEATFAVRNLSTLMVGWKPEDLFAIDSEESNIKQYGFTSSNGDKLLAIWVDNAAVDDYPGLNATLTIENMSAQNVIGIDVLNGFQQKLIFEEEDGNLIIPDLLIKDFPIIIKFIDVALVADIPEQIPMRTLTIDVGLMADIPEQSPMRTPTKEPTTDLTFTGTWQGNDVVDDSTWILTLTQTESQIEGDFSDTFSKQPDGSIIDPGFSGHGSGVLVSPTEAEMIFNLARSDGTNIELKMHLILSIQNNTLTVEISQSPPVILQPE